MNNLFEYSSRFRILKGGKISLLVSAMITTSSLYAAPTGGTVVSGTATINQSGNTTNINQSSNKAIINWQDFSIKSNETVNFNQPNVNSITLNRVIGNEKSIIDGALNANGQVWLINSNGVLFGKNAKVNTAGIVASTKDISNEDFNNGNYNFKGNSNESIVNEGEIKSLANTHATFIANSVTNKGKIEVHKGTINLVGASDVTLTLNENQNISLKVNKGVLDALVENNNLLIANGGNVYLTTNAKDELLKGVVNNSGIIEANSLEELSSEVILFAHGGTANVDGSIIAKNSFVETSGEKLNVTSNTKVVAKDWLLDPTDMKIESTGGSVLTGESVSATAIQNNLETTNVHLQATNNITVNQNITWSTTTQLNLQADNINVNATINNTNQTNGGVYFQAANTTNKVVFGTNGKVIVNNLYQLQWMNQALNGKYELGRNIDAGVTKTDTANWGTAGFNPIGNSSGNPLKIFNGTFDGKGFTISNLYINRPTENFVGLFGYVNTGSIIKDIGLENINIKGQYYVSGLVGWNYEGNITNSYVTGDVSGTNDFVGGLVGNNLGIIEDSYVTATVNGADYVGGLAGYGYKGTVKNSYTIGDVKGSNSVGGLIGSMDDGEIQESYSYMNVNGKVNVGGLVGNIIIGLVKFSYASGEVFAENMYAGGLVGFNNSGRIENSYAVGNVSGNSNIGGLVGDNWNGGVILNSYSNGNVLGFYNAMGGLVGSNSGTIKNTYSSGKVETENYLGGGLVGYDYGNIESSFYDKTKYSGDGVATGSNNGITGKTTQELSYGETFKNASWDIVLDNSTTSTTPVIKYDSVNSKYVWAIAPLTLNYTLSDKSTTYSGLTQNLSSFYNSSSDIFGANYSFIDLSKYKFQVNSVDVTGYKDADVYSGIKLFNNSDSFVVLNATGNTDGKLTINKKDLTISNIGANNKVYDGTTTATLSNSGTLVGLVTGEDLVLNNPTSVIFSSKDVGDNINVTASGYTISNKDSFKASNYNLLDTSKTTTANISKASLTATLNDNSKTYDGTSYSGGNGITFNGFVNGETASLLGGNLVYSGTSQGAKDAGNYIISGSGLTSNNYNISFVDGKLTINKKDLTISAITANNKTYDGTTTATLSNIGTLVGLVTGEDLVLNNPTSVIFSSKDVGDNINVTATGYTISNKDSFKASNYNLLDTSKTTTANIVASVNQKPKVDEQVQRVVASIEPSTNSNSSSNQSLPNSLNSNIRTLSFNGVDETRVINGGVKMPENIANEEDIIK